MKKILLTLLVLTFTAGLFSQQVPRERVLVEIATGTWCVYCPGAAMGADDLVANGHDVAILEYHNGDAYANTASNARNTYNGVSGYPNTLFDGVLEVAGGNATQSMYSSYLPKYNQRIAIDCDYVAAIYGQNTSGNDYDVTVVIDLVNGTPPSNLTAHLALTESEIQVVWQNQTELNFVCRAMYPTHTGTTVDFAGGTQMIINYTFTIDGTWNTQHIELIAFMQDESTKEILQGTMVPIENLVPLAAAANFSCSNTQPCETTSVDFYDNSIGLLTSWSWTFEGGTPATSTEQNPVVTYATPGVYDVELTVTDAGSSNTMLMTDYIEVITTPAQASAPTGPTDECGGSTGVTYSTPPVPNAVDYTWSIDPSSAGTISGTGTSAVVDISATFTGTYDVTVRANNQCGNGTWSSAFTTNVFLSPTAFWISDGGSFCEGSQGLEMTLEGSETGVDYELMKDGVGTGNILAGTGSALSFGFITELGVYSVEGFTDNCVNTMFGSSYIFPINAPGLAATPYGVEAVCAGDEETYSTNGAGDADTYVWTIDPAEAGTATGTTIDAVIVWSETWSGTATVSVMGVNDCGDGTPSDPLAVEVDAIPEPVISGEEFVMQNSTHTYSSPDHTQASYTWVVTGGTIDAGQGTSEITVSWGAPGTGTINLTELSATDCEGIAVELIINIDPVGIEESFMNEVSIYPNPVGETLNVKLYSQKDATVSIQVVNQVGQVIINSNEELSSGNNKFTINTSKLQNGYYTMKMLASDGTFVQERFIVMK